MRIPVNLILASLILPSLLGLTACKEIRDVGAVVVVSTDTPAATASSKNTPPAHAPAHGRHAKHGPPPHAPAHGYRHKQENGMELEFDSGLGVYLVVNHPEVYFHNAIYLRFFNGNWIVSVRFDGPWGSAQESQIPAKLKESAKANKGKSKGKKNNKKKG